MTPARYTVSILVPKDELRMSLRTQWEKLAKVEIGRVKIGDVEKEQIASVNDGCKALLKAAGLTVAALARRYLKQK